MVVLARNAAAGRGLLYTSAFFSGQSDFASQKACVCAVAHITKSACPTAAKKRLLPHSAAPQSTPSTPFPRQPEAKDAARPYWKPSGKEMFPLQSLIFLASVCTNCKMQLAMPALKMQKEACAGTWHRLPFGRKCRRRRGDFFCIPAIRAAETGDNERGKSQYSEARDGSI